MNEIKRIKEINPYFSETTYEFKANENNCVDVIYVNEDNIKFL